MLLRSLFLIVPPACNPNPCQNGGTCQHNYTIGYTCLCAPQYIGASCETSTVQSMLLNGLLATLLDVILLTNIIYNLYTRIGGCNKMYTAISGEVASKNYPSNYDNSLDCNITIQLPTNYKINMTWEDFAVEDDYNCGYDNLIIYDVIDNTNQKKLGKYCQRTPPPHHLSSTQNSLLLQFHSDESETRKGFRAKYVGGKSGYIRTHFRVRKTYCSHDSLYYVTFNSFTNDNTPFVMLLYI